MKRVLITGMSGTGKSTVTAELAARGYNAVDADYGGLSEVVRVPHDQQTGLGRGQDWVWREDRIRALLSATDTDVLFLRRVCPEPGQVLPVVRPHHPAQCTRPRHRGAIDDQDEQSLRILA